MDGWFVLIPVFPFYSFQTCSKKSLLKSFSGTETNVIWPKVKEYLAENFFKH